MRTRNYNLSLAALIAGPLLFAPRAFTRQVTPGNKVIRLLEREMTENNVVLTELEIEIEELEQKIAPSGSLAVDND